MVGEIEITDVTSVAVNPAPDNRVQVVWYRGGDDPPPEIAVPQTARVVVDGYDRGVLRICCTGRHPKPGGFVSIKYEEDVP